MYFDAAIIGSLVLVALMVGGGGFFIHFVTKHMREDQKKANK